MYLCTTLSYISVSKGRDVTRDVQGQTGTGRTTVPLTQDKDIFLVLVSLCPGTRAEAKIPGQTPLSRDVPGQNKFKNLKKKDEISCFRTYLPVLEHPFLF